MFDQDTDTLLRQGYTLSVHRSVAGNRGPYVATFKHASGEWAAGYGDSAEDAVERATIHMIELRHRYAG